MKKNNFILLCCFCFINTIYAQINIDINKYIENPEIVGENKEEPVSVLIPYQALDAAVNIDIEKSTYYSSLNSSWKFQWMINPYIAPKDFFTKDFNDLAWDNIPVPSNWQMQGYGHQMYRNIPMEFNPYDPPYVPHDINPTGLYRKKFQVPAGWNGRKIFLHFDGVQSAAFIWLNGKYVGYHEDGMTPAEFDITDKVEKGENLVAAMVIRWCDGSYLEDQDMYRFSGIYRTVYIYSKPELTLKDLFIKTDLDEKYTDADLILDLKLKNYSEKRSKVKIRYTLYDSNNKQILTNNSHYFEVSGGLENSIKQKVKNPKKWSDEKPYLYKLVLELLDEDGNVLEINSQRVGFRELEVKNGIAMMNGVPVYFRGTNRHESSPVGGKSLTRELMIKDIKLLKEFNFNSVRMSHYPNNPEWYDLCDEYGILLQDEVNAECHYTENTFPERKEYLKAFMDRFIRMVQRDKNHPSVVMWSTGNECGLNTPHYMMADYIRKFDPTRFLMHQANGMNGTAPYSDIAGPRYPAPSFLRQFGLNSEIPVVMGEYAHAMGNSLGNFDEFWETIYEIPKLQGGFVWDWVDQGLNVKARFVKDYSGNNIQCGVMGNPELVGGIDDNAIKLSGLDDWIEVYDHPVLDITGNNLVIEAKVHPQKFYIENPLVTKGYQYGIIQISKDTLSFYINSYKNRLEIKLPDDWYSDWHTIRAVYNGKQMALFIDGKEYGSKKYDRKINSFQYPVNIGRDSYTDNDQHLGWLSNFIFDEVKIFDAVNETNSLPLLWLKFDKITDGEDYLTYGISPFCINGMVTADREPQPELWQAKHSMSPVRFYSENPSAGIFEAVNKYSFTNLNEFDIDWILYKDGSMEKTGNIYLDVKPQSQKEFKIPIPSNLNNQSEYILEVRCRLKKDELLRKRGFEVYFRHFVLNQKEPVNSSLKAINNSKIKINENDSVYTVITDNVKYRIKKSTGALDLFNNDNLLISSMSANIWKAPISNERSEWGKAESDEWYKMGMNELTNKVDSFEVIIPVDSQKVLIRIKSYTNFSRSSDLVINNFEYAFRNDGSVKINHKMIPLGNFDVSWLPCMGVSLKMPDEYQSVSWYGRGPEENYIDRNTGTRIGIHEAIIDSVQNPYIQPQAYGNYSEVRWFEIKNKKGKGIKVSADKPFNFSAVPHYNLDRAKYVYQLLKDNFSRIQINYGVSGVGETPNPTMPQYRLYPEIYSSSYSIVPL